jgi:hypothetical protein
MGQRLKNRAGEALLPVKSQLFCPIGSGRSSPTGGIPSHLWRHQPQVRQSTNAVHAGRVGPP